MRGKRPRWRWLGALRALMRRKDTPSPAPRDPRASREAREALCNSLAPEEPSRLAGRLRDVLDSEGVSHPTVISNVIAEAIRKGLNP